MSTENAQQPNSNPSAGSAKLPVRRRTMFKCVVCGKITAGRISREGRLSGDMSERFPRRHKVDGQDCPGNIEEAEWVDVPRYGA